jgi:sugar lactone lactonase YvrE
MGDRMRVSLVEGSPRCGIGEGPVQSGGRLTWVDIHRGDLHGWDGYSFERWELGGPLSAALPLGGSTLTVTGDRIEVIPDLAVPSTRRHLATVPLGGALRCNDARIDPEGRLWVGTMGGPAGSAALWCIDPDDPEPRRVLADLDVANGMGWSPDGAVMYLVETRRRRVLERRAGRWETLIGFDGVDGNPDGLHVDADGTLWIAMFRGGQLCRYSPTGELLTVVALPVQHPTSVARFGERLIVTSASRTPMVSDDHPFAGRLLAVEKA